MKQRPEANKSFDLTVEGLVNPIQVKNCQERKSLIILAHFIKRTLKQFHIEQVNFYDVVNEVYLRGITSIDLGNKIKNPGAWIRVTSYNFIREVSRKQKKEQADSELIINLVSSENFPETNEDDLKIVQNLLQNLNEIDRKILYLRFFRNFSWKQVVNELASTGIILTEDNTRQKARRILKRLQKAF